MYVNIPYLDAMGLFWFTIKNKATPCDFTRGVGRRQVQQLRHRLDWVGIFVRHHLGGVKPNQAVVNNGITRWAPIYRGYNSIYN